MGRKYCIGDRVLVWSQYGGDPPDTTYEGTIVWFDNPGGPESYGVDVAEFPYPLSIVETHLEALDVLIRNCEKCGREIELPGVLVEHMRCGHCNAPNEGWPLHNTVQPQQTVAAEEPPKRIKWREFL